jgi:hypothetical protein
MDTDPDIQTSTCRIGEVEKLLPFHCHQILLNSSKCKIALGGNKASKIGFLLGSIIKKFPHSLSSYRMQMDYILNQKDIAMASSTTMKAW